MGCRDVIRVETTISAPMQERPRNRDILLLRVFGVIWVFNELQHRVRVEGQSRGFGGFGHFSDLKNAVGGGFRATGADRRLRVASGYCLDTAYRNIIGYYVSIAGHRVGSKDQTAAAKRPGTAELLC